MSIRAVGELDIGTLEDWAAVWFGVESGGLLEEELVASSDRHCPGWRIARLEVRRRARLGADVAKDQ